VSKPKKKNPNIKKNDIHFIDDIHADDEKIEITDELIDEDIKVNEEIPSRTKKIKKRKRKERNKEY